MSVGNRRFETQQAIERLKTGKAGDVITAAEMSEIVMCQCWETKSRGYTYVLSAINATIRDHRVYWVRETHERVYKCAGTRQSQISTDAQIRKSARSAKKGLQISLCMDEATLTKEEQFDRRCSQMQANLIVAAASKKVRNQLSGDKIHQPDFQAVLEGLVKQ